jgi:general stress protein 26
MEVLTDQESKDMIWRDGDTQYYAEGVTDSGLLRPQIHGA